MDNAPNILETTKRLGRNQRLILQLLYTSPHPIKKFSSVKNTILNLQAKGCVELKEDQVFLTSLGQAVCELWQEKGSEISASPSEPEKGDRKQSSKSAKLSQKNLEKSNQFLDLYKQELSYQDIGDKYGLSRERVRQILSVNPAFNEYVEKRDKAKAAAELEKEEKNKQKLSKRSLANLYLERVVELWDFEKNKNLNPEEVLAYSSTQIIWLKCPIDGHSWKKKVADITAIWKNNGTSGCPLCAGKTKKPEKQLSLQEVYSELVEQYWDYKKNTELSLEPVKLTLGSNRKAWFRCPSDGNEWQAIIASTVKQQWSKGNAGCQVCNGTDERKRGGWQRREPIAVEFPAEVAKYWFYEANNKLKLDPMKLTIGSSKEAFFKCPIDGHEWVATITAIAKGSWEKAIADVLLVVDGLRLKKHLYYLSIPTM